MSRLVILGSASVVADDNHENTHMVLEGNHGSTILIDCVGRPLVRLKRVGIDFETLDAVILTHFHPDHVLGLPNLLLGAWILGRKKPLDVYGLQHCMERVETLMTAFHWENWTGFFPTALHHLPQKEGLLVLDNEDFKIWSAPVRHYVPTIGLRVLVKDSGFIFAYSSDTIPCVETVRLAHGADLLIHEATGDEPLGHSSAAQAGAIAKQAKVKRLGLIHYPVWQERTNHLVLEAEATFDGDVFLCTDFQSIQLG